MFKKVYTTHMFQHLSRRDCASTKAAKAQYPNISNTLFNHLTYIRAHSPTTKDAGPSWHDITKGYSTQG